MEISLRNSPHVANADSMNNILFSIGQGCKDFISSLLLGL